MRTTIAGLAVALAVAASAAPAAACGYSGCSSPSWNYNYSGFYGNYSAPVAPCATACGGYYGAAMYGYGRLPYPAQPYATLPQYYYVNQGPTYSGPGMVAPAPTYQERAVSGWSGYGPTAYGTTNYSYSGGPYSNATTHYYDGMPAAGYTGYQSYSDQPRTYSYQSDEDVPAPVYRPYYARPMYHYARPYRRMIAPRYYRAVRYGYAPRYRHYVGVRRYAMPPRYMAPRYMAHRYAPRFIAPRYVARPRMSLRYGVPQPMVRQGYAPRMGYAPMPQRRMYQPMYR